MKNIELEKKIEEIKNLVESTNKLMAELHEQGMEIRINYTDASGGEPPKIAIWRAVAHVDYLK